MGISIRNHEGYLDPTTYEALTNVERERYEKAHPLAVRQFRPVVYICSPYVGDVPGNTERARKYSRFAIEQGCIPITPHLLYPQFLDETQKDERELGLFIGLVLMSKCAELWVFGSRVSSGMAQEIAKAESKGMPTRYFTEDMEEVCHG